MPTKSINHGAWAETITLDAMSDILIPHGFSPITLSGVHERVFGKLIEDVSGLYQLRVFTSIVDSESRKIGKDAIKVCMFRADPKGGTAALVGTAKKVYRMKGWEDLLLDRITNYKDLLPEGPCPCCDGVLVHRQARRTKNRFLGCTNWPECQHNESLPESAQPKAAKHKTYTHSHNRVCDCDKCGSPMVKRKGPYGEFVGCTSYPKCKNTKKLN